MADTDNDAAGGTSPQQPTAADLLPGTVGWRVSVAMGAHKFFWMPHDPGVAAVIRKELQPTTYEPWALHDYSA